MRSASATRPASSSGAEWTPVIKQALQTSLNLVYVLSPNFFYREFCGKEFHIFCERLKLDTSEIAARQHDFRYFYPCCGSRSRVGCLRS